MRIHHHPLKQGIKKSPDFAKKKLAQFAVNVGTKCGHGCTYCSTGTMNRCHRSFKAANENPFENGYAIIDPDIPEKVAADAKRIQKRGMIQLCTTVDAWSPEAQELQMGRRCLEAILSQPGWTVRILTKNAAVALDFDFIKKHRDRVLVGISLTGTPNQENIMSAVEPNASPLRQRFDAMLTAHRFGLRTYAMFCPLLPGIATSPEQIEELVGFAKQIGAEEIFAEAVNPRGPGLKLTQEALERAFCVQQAAAVEAIRQRKHWSPYVVDLIRNVQAAVRERDMLNKLRFLLYPTGLTTGDRKLILKDDAGVIWL
jgi:DNA repair photolyase